jgi:hypothetical protein
MHLPHLVVPEPSVRNLRERNRQDQKRLAAIDAAVEHLEVYDRIRRPALDADKRRLTLTMLATLIVDGTLATMRGGIHE